MTMQAPYSPKPKIFGKGYGKHLSENFKLMTKFFWLAWKMLVHTLIPHAFYEKAHWEVIDLFYKMRGYRHGTSCDHRCDTCGADKPSVDEVFDLREAKETIAKMRLQIADLEQQVPSKEEQKDTDSE